MFQTYSDYRVNPQEWHLREPQTSLPKKHFNADKLWKIFILIFGILAAIWMVIYIYELFVNPYYYWYF